MSIKNEKIFDVNWNKLGTWLIPVPMRKSKMIAWVLCLLSPINDLYNRFINYRNYTNYWLGITPQVCYMRKALNDRYDYTLRRITIEDASEKTAVPLFLKEENKPVKLYQKSEGHAVILFTKEETAQFTVDFIVKVPVFVAFDLKEMTAFITRMKLPSKTFKIVIV